jgi:hypothetical protein
MSLFQWRSILIIKCHLLQWRSFLTVIWQFLQWFLHLTILCHVSQWRSILIIECRLLQWRALCVITSEKILNLIIQAFETSDECPSLRNIIFLVDYIRYSFMKLKIALLFTVKSDFGPFLVIPIELMPYFFNMSVNIVFILRSRHYGFSFMWEKRLFSLFCPQMFHIFCPSHFPSGDKINTESVQ